MISAGGMLTNTYSAQHVEMVLGLGLYLPLSCRPVPHESGSSIDHMMEFLFSSHPCFPTARFHGFSHVGFKRRGISQSMPWHCEKVDKSSRRPASLSCILNL